MTLKRIDTEGKTVICYWCGCTNHADPERKFYEIDSIRGHQDCWNIVKTVLMRCGHAFNKTEMRSLVQIMKHIRTRKHSSEETIILFRDGSMIMNATNEDTKQVEEGGPIRRKAYFSISASS